MTLDSNASGPSGIREFFGGVAVGASVNLLLSAAAWLWAFDGGTSYPNDGIRDWLIAIVISALAVSFVAVIIGQRRWLVGGVVAGSAGAVGLDLAGLFLAILRHSE